jgi:opacity protein-like surface antigen
MQRIVGTLLLVALVCALAPSAGWAQTQTQVGLRGAGLSFGLVEPEDIDAAFGFGALVDLGNVARDVRLEAHADYWWKSEEAFGVETSVRDLSLGARSKYVFPITNPRLRPFAGAGLGIHFVSAEVYMPEQDLGFVVIPATVVKDSDTKIGLDLGGGLAYGLNARASLLTELWYTLVSDVNQLNLKFGVLWKLGS